MIDENEHDIPGMLPDTFSEATLPRTYERAKAVLARCEKVDECKDWADRGLALASYARQAQDDELEMHARRIRNRAIRRMGELLERIEPAPGARTDLGGAHPQGRGAAAREAGISPDQQKQAQRVARVPESDFEAATERDRPATVTELAEIGTRSFVSRRKDPVSSAFVSALEAAAVYADRRDVVEGLDGEDLARAGAAALALTEIAAAVIARCALHRHHGGGAA